VVICLERGADLHTAQLMPLPLTVSCFSKNPDWFYLSGIHLYAEATSKVSQPSKLTSLPKCGFKQQHFTINSVSYNALCRHRRALSNIAIHPSVCPMAQLS